VYDLGGNAMTLEKVGQPEEPHGQEVDPDEMTDRPVIIGQFGNMEKNKIKTTHGGIVRCSHVIFQPELKKIARPLAQKRSNIQRVLCPVVVRLAVFSSDRTMGLSSLKRDALRSRLCASF
jgi:hypothetical protein